MAFTATVEDDEWALHADLGEHSRPEMTRTVTAMHNNHNGNDLKARESHRRPDNGKALKIAIYGAVNAMMAIPILYGYAAIIFRHPLYAPFMPALAKLILFSSMVHQIIFSVMSTLPFAIGQVQDAGLIFLSRMTTDVAKRAVAEGKTAEEAIATALATTALGTATLGLALVIVGKLKLARFVAYLPMPVVGGYLAFIGLFCLEAGLDLASGKDIRGINTWGQLLNQRDIALCLPCVASGVLWSWVSRKYEHFAVLPLTMLAVPAVFFIGLGMSGHDMQAARDYGLVGAVTEPAKLSWSFALFRWDLVDWSVFRPLVPVWIGMVFVVTFSSSLDVAAIEIDMGEPLNTNKELNTVGWSNVLSGLTGGFTGSYIFSQTLFTRRTGCDSRLVGWVVAVSELIVCLVTIDPLAFVPLAFFAATLTFIAVDLSVEWLYEVREKLLTHEYLVLLITFVSIQIVGLNHGLMVGVACSLFIFVVNYASERRNTLERVHKRGRVMRPATQRRLLQVHREKILCVELKGELFFGSSQQVLQQVKRMLGLDDSKHKKAAHEADESAHTPGDAVRRWFWHTMKAIRKRMLKKASSHTRSPGSARRSHHRGRVGRSGSLGGDEDRRRLLGSNMNVHGSASSNGHRSRNCSIGGSTNTTMTIVPRAWSFAGDDTAALSKKNAANRVNFSSNVSFSNHQEKQSLSNTRKKGRKSFPPEEGDGERSERVQSIPKYRSRNRDRSQEGSAIIGASSSMTSYGAASIVSRDNVSKDRKAGAIGVENGHDEEAEAENGSLLVRGEDSITYGVETGGEGATSSSLDESVDEDSMPSFILLDCSKVTNIDASAVRTCFLPLQRATEQHGICIAYAGLTDRMETLLGIHKAIGRENVAVFATFFSAVDWCETQLIRSLSHDDDASSHTSYWATSHFSRRDGLRSPAASIKQLLRQILDLPEAAAAVEGVERYCYDEEYEAGDVIFSPGDAADSYFVLTAGQVQMEISPDGSSRPQEPRHDTGDRQRTNSVARAGGQVVFGVGAIFGYVDFQLEEPRSHSAIAATDCTVCAFSRPLLDKMMEENPRLLCLVERSVMKYLALELTNLPV